MPREPPLRLSSFDIVHHCIVVERRCQDIILITAESNRSDRFGVFEDCHRNIQLDVEEHDPALGISTQDVLAFHCDGSDGFRIVLVICFEQVFAFVPPQADNAGRGRGHHLVAVGGDDVDRVVMVQLGNHFGCFDVLHFDFLVLECGNHGVQFGRCGQVLDPLPLGFDGVQHPLESDVLGSDGAVGEA